MSFEAVSWALAEGERRDLDTSQRFLLLLLGSILPPDGQLFPSHGYLASRTGMSRATVKRHMRKLEACGLIIKETRARDHDGSQTSNLYYLAFAQAGLLLDDQSTPRGQIDPGVTGAPGGGSQLRPGGRVTAMTPHEVKDVKKDVTLAKGAKRAPSAVAQCWQVYKTGMKARYGVEPPPSSKSNGQLASIVGRVGAERAPELVAFYLAHHDKFYATVNHSLDFLVRDCTPKLWNEMGRQTGRAAAPAATKAVVSFEYESGKARGLQDYPLGDPLEIARTCRHDYAKMVANTHPKNVVVQIGHQAHRYTLAELDTGRRA